MKILQLSTILTVCAACTNPAWNSNNPAAENDVSKTSTILSESHSFHSVSAAFETEAVNAGTDDDAADDPAIWYNPVKPDQSLIIGSNKKQGIDIYNLEGKLLQTHNVGRINNVDVRSNVWFNETHYDIVGGSNRSTNTIDFWYVLTDSASLISLGSIQSNLTEVYGFCLYHDRNKGNLYAFVNDKTGKIEQWDLEIEKNQIVGQTVRTLQLHSQVEGMVADDLLSKIYIGVERGGVYRFDARPDIHQEGKLILNSDSLNPHIAYDIEGLTIYPEKQGQGYLIVSSQGNNSFAVFDRSGENKYLGSFSVTANHIDGAEETDGIDICSLNLGRQFPKGIFVCQDGFNFDDGQKKSQNFKIVEWGEIEKVISDFSKN